MVLETYWPKIRKDLDFRVLTDVPHEPKVGDLILK